EARPVPLRPVRARAGIEQRTQNAPGGDRNPYRGRCSKFSTSGRAGAGSDTDDVLGLRAAGAGNDLELHALVLLQVPETGALDGAVVHESVGATVVGG